MADSWHFKLLGAEYGPVPFEALFNLAQSSSIGPDDEVREGEAGEWTPASSIVGLIPTFQENSGESNATVAEPPTEGSSTLPLVPISTPSAADSVLFYWRSFGQEFGPVPLDNFKEMIQREQFSADDGVRVEAADGWLPVGLLNELSTSFPRTIAAASAPTISTPTADGRALFYWRSFGQEFGPVPLNDFKEMIQREQLSGDDCVRVEAADGWLPIGVLSDLSMAFQPAANVTDAAEEFTLQSGLDRLDSADPFAELAAQVGLEEVDADDIFDAVMSAPAVEQPPPAATNIEEPAIAAAQPVVPPPTPVASSTGSPSFSEPPKPSVAPSPKPLISPPPKPKPSFSPPPKPSKPKRSGPLIDWGSLFSNVKLSPKLLIPLGIGLVVVLYMYVPWGSGADREHFVTLVGFRDEFHQLRERKATSAEWKALEDRVLSETKPMIIDLKKRGGANNRLPQHLLFAARDFLPAMFKTSRQNPNEDELQFDANLRNASFLMGDQPEF